MAPSRYMSFDPVAEHYVNGSFIIWHLVDIVAKGGQMQIGYGPDANGRFHPRAVAALEYTGRWLETNGVSIYYTRPLVQPDGNMSWHDSASTQVRYTRSKDNTTIYAIALAGFGSTQGWMVGQRLKLEAVCATPGSQIFLLGYQHEANRSLIPMQWSSAATATPGARASQGGVVINVPSDVASHPSITDPGLVFVIKGQPALDGC
jgi:hypothetical protein